MRKISNRKMQLHLMIQAQKVEPEYVYIKEKPPNLAEIISPLLQGVTYLSFVLLWIFAGGTKNTGATVCYAIGIFCLIVLVFGTRQIKNGLYTRKEKW